MLQDWEAGPVGNNPGTVARLPRKELSARVVINLIRARRGRSLESVELPSAA